MSGIVPYGLRMSPALKARVEDAARTNGRSLNSEIVACLDANYGDHARAELAKNRILSMRLTDAPDPVIERLRLLEDRVAALEGKA